MLCNRFICGQIDLFDILSIVSVFILCNSDHFDKIKAIAIIQCVLCKISTSSITVYFASFATWTAPSSILTCPIRMLKNIKGATDFWPGSYTHFVQVLGLWKACSVQIGSILHFPSVIIVLLAVFPKKLEKLNWQLDNNPVTKTKKMKLQDEAKAIPKNKGIWRNTSPLVNFESHSWDHPECFEVQSGLKGKPSRGYVLEKASMNHFLAFWLSKYKWVDAKAKTTSRYRALQHWSLKLPSLN